MDREYIISNICDHFAFEEDVDKAKDRAVEFVLDYLRKYGMETEEFKNIIDAIFSLWKFCKYDKNEE